MMVPLTLLADESILAMREGQTVSGHCGRFHTSAYAARIQVRGSREDEMTRKSFGIFHAVFCLRPLHGPNCFLSNAMMLLDPVFGTLTYAMPARRQSNHGTCSHDEISKYYMLHRVPCGDK